MSHPPQNPYIELDAVPTLRVYLNPGSSAQCGVDRIGSLLLNLTIAEHSIARTSSEVSSGFDYPVG